MRRVAEIILLAFAAFFLLSDALFLMFLDLWGTAFGVDTTALRQAYAILALATLGTMIAAVLMHWRPRVAGIMGAVAALGATGFLVTILGWEIVFWTVLPIALAGTAAGLAFGRRPRQWQAVPEA